MLPHWLIMLLVVFAEAWSARRDDQNQVARIEEHSVLEEGIVNPTGPGMQLPVLP